MADTISKEQSDILVAIGKLETKLDGVMSDVANARSEIKEINSGLANRVLNLEGNAVSKLEVNSQFDDVHEELEKTKEELGDLKAAVKSQTDTTSTWRWVLAVFVGPAIIAAVGWLWVSYYQFTSTNDARMQRTITTDLINFGLIKN